MSTTVKVPLILKTGVTGMKVFVYDSAGAIQNSGGTTLTEVSSSDGLFTATLTPTLAGTFRSVVKDGAVNVWDSRNTVINGVLTLDDGNIGAAGTASVSVTIPPSVAKASQSPGLITCVRGDLLAVTLPVMGTITSRTGTTFTVKERFEDPDSKAIIQITENDGLVWFCGDSETVSGYGSLVISDASTGTVVITIKAERTALLDLATNNVWDCQYVTTAGPKTPVSGYFTVTPDVTRAIA